MKKRIIGLLALGGLAALLAVMRTQAPDNDPVSPPREERAAGAVQPDGPGLPPRSARDRAVPRAVERKVTGADLVPEGSTLLSAKQVDEFMEEYAALLMQKPEEARERAFVWSTPEVRQRIIDSFDPAESAEWRYHKEGWGGFVEGIEVSEPDRRKVRDMILQHFAHRSELIHLGLNGVLDFAEAASAAPSLESLASRLGSILSASQIDGFWATHEAYREANRKRDEIRREKRIANGHVGIIQAAGSDDLAAVRAHVAAGDDVNRMTLDGETFPLVDAAIHGNLEMVQVLLDAGADPNLLTQDHWPTSALRVAASKGDIEMIRLLAAAGADPSRAAEPGSPKTPLASAAQNGYTDAVRELLALGADASGEAGQHSLWWAIRHGDREMERMLIDAGANHRSPMVILERATREVGRRLGYVTEPSEPD